jgi:hypothetical protein
MSAIVPVRVFIYLYEGVGTNSFSEHFPAVLATEKSYMSFCR